MTQREVKLDDYFLKKSEQYVHPNTFVGHSKGLYKITINTNGHVTNAESVTASDLEALGVINDKVQDYYWDSSNKEIVLEYTTNSNTGSNIGTIDATIDKTSNNAISNSAVANALEDLNEAIGDAITYINQ